LGKWLVNELSGVKLTIIVIIEEDINVKEDIYKKRYSSLHRHLSSFDKYVERQKNSINS
jgi:hypothetical protein